MKKLLLSILLSPCFVQAFSFYDEVSFSILHSSTYVSKYEHDQEEILLNTVGISEEYTEPELITETQHALPAFKFYWRKKITDNYSLSLNIDNTNNWLDYVVFDLSNKNSYSAHGECVLSWDIKSKHQLEMGVGYCFGLWHNVPLFDHPTERMNFTCPNSFFLVEMKKHYKINNKPGFLKAQFSTSPFFLETHIYSLENTTYLYEEDRFRLGLTMSYKLADSISQDEDYSCFEFSSKMHVVSFGLTYSF